jgi:cobalamin biosynthesis protein CobD/CbiB
MLLSVLSKVAGVVGEIIKHPIRFLGNLISGVSKGFNNFAKNIKKHLIGGLVGWLTGALGPLGIQLPDDIFSLQGIFSLVVQVLGLSWDVIRAKAVKLLGEPAVKALEQGFELFQVLINEGPAGLWRFLKDQFSDLKETVMGAIEDMIKTEVVEAGIEWIMGLMTPAGAFIKAAKAIYKIVMFFVEKGSQVMELVNSVIDGIGAIASGAVSGAASLIENALARALPLVIGFLASLLGLDDLAEKVQKIIQSIRTRIDKAIDGLIQKAAKSVGGLVGKGREKVAQFVNWWRIRKKFTTTDKESHTAYFTGEGKAAKLVIASDPQTIDVFINNQESKITPDSPPRATALIKELRGLSLQLAFQIGNNKTPEQIPEIMELIITKIRELWGILGSKKDKKAFEGKNIAVASYRINGEGGILASLSGGEEVHLRHFTAFIYPVESAHLRHKDAEVKLLMQITDEINKKYPQTEQASDSAPEIKPNRKVTGEVYLSSDFVFCPSCSFVIKQFRQKFPGVILVPVNVGNLPPSEKKKLNKTKN